MKRILSTTALLVALSTTAHAENHAKTFGTVTFEQSDFFASDLIGMRIYNSETELDAETPITAGAEQEWDDIGEINDIILSKDGEVRAVILGIGGFLGLGERDVSVSMDTIKVVREEGDMGDRFLVVTTSKEALEQAPEFKRDMDARTEAAMDADTDTDAALPVASADASVTDTDTEMDLQPEAQTATDLDADTDRDTTMEADAETEMDTDADSELADNAKTEAEDEIKKNSDS